MVSGAIVPIVLIETLWNVKYDRSFRSGCILTRINRNIVECKVQIRVVLNGFTHSINRNIVECKV